MALYFGEIHTHTGLSDGRGEPADAFAVGRAHLDFCALADHAQWHDAPKHEGFTWAQERLAGWQEAVPAERDRWPEVQKLVRDYYEPGQFVTFLAYEWSSQRWGDHNVYYLRDDEPIRYADSLAELYAKLDGVDCMVFPHHTAYPPHHRGYDWEGFDNSKAPVVEIYSSHGSSETDETRYHFTGNPMGPRCPEGTLQRALELGHVIGFIGSSDGHDSFPGTHGRGLVGVYADELTRESLWDSFWKRRVYAVTGDRIRLDFGLNEAAMGEVVSAGVQEPRRLKVEVDGWDCLDVVEVVKNGRAVQQWAGFGLKSAEGARRFKVGFEWGYHSFPFEREWNILIEVTGGRVAGIGPCFKQQRGAPAGFHRAAIRNPQTLEITSKTGSPRPGGGQFQHVDLDIEGGPDTRMIVRLDGQAVIEGTIGELLRESRHAIPYGHYAGTAILGRAVPEAQFHAKLEWEDAVAEKERDYYYIRAFQKNGQGCWSSPIWVERS